MGEYESEVALLAGSDFAMEHSKRWLANVWGNLLGGEVDAPGLPFNSHSNGYEKWRAIKSGAGVLFGFTARSSNVAAQFIQLHDANTIPANGAVPVCVFDIALTATLAVSFIFPGRFFERGIIVATSTTAPTLTLGAADTFFDSQFI
jgi:hypothetical protein